MQWNDLLGESSKQTKARSLNSRGLGMGFICVRSPMMIWVNVNPRPLTHEMSHEHNPHQN